MRKRVKRPSPAMIVAVLALCTSLVGTGAAATISALDQSEKTVVKKISRKIANKRINRREGRLDVDGARHANRAVHAIFAEVADNVMAASVTSGCAGVDGSTGVITASPSGSECRVTFPEKITFCPIVLGAQLDSAGGGETTYRKVSPTVVEVSRRDSAGGPPAGGFSIAAICFL